jgi:hypothetical protein
MKLYSIDNTLQNAPDGSFVKQYTHKTNNSHNNYHIFLNKNLGYARHDTESAILIIPTDFTRLSFDLSSDDNLNTLKTPLKLIDIIDENQTSLLSLYLHNHIYWFKTPQSYQKLPLFLEQQAKKITIDNHASYLNFIVDKQNFKIPLSPHNTLIKIGIIRSDLLRYRGQIIPEQSVYVTNIHMIKHHAQ